MHSRLLFGVTCLVLSVTACAEKSDSAEQEPTTSGATSSSGPSSEPTTQQPPEGAGITINVTISDGEVEPVAESVDAAVGQPITLAVKSDSEDELHVHSDPEHEFEISAGESKKFTFTIDRPGQVIVESHETGVVIAKITVQ